jgi:hypothetical protein
MESNSEPLVNPVEKQGWMHKRTGKFQVWRERYFVLTGGDAPAIHYKYKIDGPVKSTFDLTKGCVVTEISEEMKSGKKVFLFWLLWPELEASEADGAGSRAAEGNKNDGNLQGKRSLSGESDGENDPRSGAVSPLPGTTSTNSGGGSSGSGTRSRSRSGSGEAAFTAITGRKDSEDSNGRERDFKKIVESEVKNYKTQKQFVEQELEKHQTQDNNMKMGVKVAALTVGGVVVGALTAGIGLVPYITVVGLTAAASGGAVALQYRRPAGSRLILACDCMADAIEWKSVLDTQISRLDKQNGQRPAVSQISSNTAHIISNMVQSVGIDYLDTNDWTRVRIQEGMQILTNIPLLDNHQQFCRKAQLVIGNSPLSIFLTMMEMPNPFWPMRGQGESKMLKVLDDHSDICEVTVNSSYSLKPLHLLLSRFWKLDDDGMYLITYNSVDKLQMKDKYANESSGNNSDNTDNNNHNAKKIDEAKDESGISFNAVFTVAPRRDHDEYDVDILEALVTCTLQIDFKDDIIKRIFFDNEDNINSFIDEFILQCLELRASLQLSKFKSPKIFPSRSSACGLDDTEARLSSSSYTLDSSFNGRSTRQMRKLSRGKAEKELNSEAFALRNQIAAKEYEIMRLETEMRQRDFASNILEEELEIGSRTSGGIRSSLIEQQAELDAVKEKYFGLTGTSYYSSMNRASFDDRDRLESDTSTLYEDYHRLSSRISSKATTVVEKALSKPSFWKNGIHDKSRTRSLKLNQSIVQAQASAEITKRNIGIIFYFMMGMAAILFTRRLLQFLSNSSLHTALLELFVIEE